MTNLKHPVTFFFFFFFFFFCFFCFFFCFFQMFLESSLWLQGNPRGRVQNFGCTQLYIIEFPFSI